MPKVALIGPPNAGKTSLFNFLTGSNQQVANYPGVTVDITEGMCRFHSDTTVIDLPGIYYLNKNSIDAQIATEAIENDTSIDYFLLVIDSNRLAQSIFLIEQINATGRPFILVMNMLDELHIRGGYIDTQFLTQYYRRPVFSCSTKNKMNLQHLTNKMREVSTTPMESYSKNSITHNEIIEKSKGIIEKTILKKSQSHKLTDRLDAVFLNPYKGGAFLLFITYIIFQSIFSWVSPIQDAIISVLDYLGKLLTQSDQVPATLKSFIQEGLIGGVGSILVFLPQIILLFFFIALMEFTGYMTRASMLLDYFFEKIGLEGKSFFPLFSANACAVPAIISTRIIANDKVRFITAFITPLVTCSARLPVYFIIITAFVPNINYFNIISLRTIVYLLIYLTSTVTIVFTSFALSKLLKTNLPSQTSSYVMELPTYRMPSPMSIYLFIKHKVIMFLKRVTHIILPLMLIIWFLSHFPGDSIEDSFLSYLGKAIAPLLEPLGFDWKISVAILSSLIARETVISTLGLLYKAGGSDSQLINTFIEHLSMAQGFSILVFFIFSLQCVSTLGVMKREMGGWKYPASAFIYMFALAYLFSSIVYNYLK